MNFENEASKYLATVNDNLVTLNITLQSKHSSTFSSPLFLRKT